VPVSTLRFGQSGQAAVAITGLLAYSQGSEITVTRLIRPGIPGMDEDLPSPRDTPAGRRALAGRLISIGCRTSVVVGPDSTVASAVPGRKPLRHSGTDRNGIGFNAAGPCPSINSYSEIARLAISVFF
jgi:hypothetical protein